MKKRFFALNSENEWIEVSGYYLGMMHHALSAKPVVGERHAAAT